MTNAPQQALVTRQTTALSLTGSTRSASDLAQRLASIADQAHVVAPAMSAATLPEGCEVVTSAVLIDVAHETYKVGTVKEGNEYVETRGLGKVALEKIAGAAGISWDPSASGRLDDGSDPYYCAWRVVGNLRHFDGTEVTIEGSKEMDLREGSPQLQALFDRAKTGKSKDPTAQIREMRLHIMAHAESKARLRAIRSIGLRPAYTATELKKPFVVARLVFSGRSADPETQRAFSMMTAQAMLGGRRALYGGERDSRALPAPRTVQALPKAAPPPVGSVLVDEDDLPDSWNKAPQPVARTEQRQAQPTPAQQTQDRQREPGDDDDYEDDGAESPQSTTRSGYSIPGGQEKGTPIEDASDNSVDYWAGRIATSLDSGTSRSPARDRDLLAALRAEQESRR
jgi:hypothetical protein